MFPLDLIARATELIAGYRAAGLMAATAESCTGGLIAALLTEIPGSSTVLERGFVVYSNAAKQELLGVPAETLASHGAVSRETAVAMAEGALRASRAEVALSVTGIAGPDGGSAAKPVGLVHFALARRGAATIAREERFGDIGREAVRLASVRVGLDLLEAAGGA
jgi:nicotinamide-nucleotide amidase